MPRSTNESRLTGVPEGSADHIIQVARQLFEERGVARTTIAEVMREAGFSRELFYYYFKGKDDLIDKVLDSYVNDAVDSVRLWAERCAAGEQGFDDYVAYFRRFLFDLQGNRRKMADVLDETCSFYEVIGRATKGSARILRGTPFYQTCERRGVGNIDQAVIFTLCGALSLLRLDPPATDEEIADISRRIFLLDD
jgi:AcrR family transcriptional regulator